MIRDRGKKYEVIEMSNFKGILFGPIDLPVLNKAIVSDNSHGTARNMKKECGFLL